MKVNTLSHVIVPILPKHRTLNQDVLKKWSPDMAYVLGFFYADGNMVKTQRNTHFISFHSADRVILEGIQQFLGSNHTISARTTDTGCVYRLQIGSKVVFHDLLRLGCTPGKSRRLHIPEIPYTCFGHFVRGYFDGDGNIWIGKVNTKRKHPTNVIQVAFTCASKTFLETLKMKLIHYGLQGGALYSPQSKNFSRLTYSTQDALKLYEIMYNEHPKLYLKRKKFRFEEFIKLRA